MRSWPVEAVTVVVLRPLDAEAGFLSCREEADRDVQRLHPIETHQIRIEILAFRRVNGLATGGGGGAVVGGSKCVAHRRCGDQTRFSRGGKHRLAQVDVHCRGVQGFGYFHHIRPKEFVSVPFNELSKVFHQNPAFPIVGFELRESGGLLVKPEGTLLTGHLSCRVRILDISYRLVFLRGRNRRRKLVGVDRIDILDPAARNRHAGTIERALRPVNLAHGGARAGL